MCGPSRQTHDGYVWLAAFDGFVRFDGERAVLYSGKSVPGLPAIPKGDKVFADAAGLLWATTTDGRLFSFDQVNWREYRASHGWPGLVVESIAQNAGGRLIFSGARSVVQYADGHFTPLALPESPADFLPPFKVLFDAKGKLWLTSPSHVWREERAEWKLVCSPSILKTSMHGVAPARDGGLWIATSHDVRKYVGDTPVTTLTRPEGFLGETLALLEDFHGNVWGGSPSKGLRIWTPDGRILKAGRSVDSLSPQITCLFEDRERNVLSSERMAPARPGSSRRAFVAWFGQLGGLAGAMVNSIGEDPAGRASSSVRKAAVCATWAERNRLR